MLLSDISNRYCNTFCYAGSLLGSRLLCYLWSKRHVMPCTLTIVVVVTNIAFERSLVRYCMYMLWFNLYFPLFILIILYYHTEVRSNIFI